MLRVIPRTGDACAIDSREHDHDDDKAAYRGNYDRLVQIKRRYDPTNLFHINHNISPF
jgi:FAD/FMN-containing dehydrogenase